MPEKPPVTNFGADTEEVVSKLIKAIKDTHDRHVEAQKVSGQKGERVYAQLWSALPAVCTEALRKNWVTCTTVKPGRAGYELPVLHETILFPWRPPGGNDPEVTPFITSPSRGSLFATPPSDQGMLDLEGASAIESPEHASEAEVRLDDVMGIAEKERLAVVVVGVVSGAANLWKIVWGEVNPKADGSGLLEFSSFDELYVPDHDAIVTAREEEGRTFDAGQPRRAIVKKRPAQNE